MSNTLEITGILLAGGKSTRMKIDKTGLVHGSYTLPEMLAMEMKKVCSRIIIVTGENILNQKDCICVQDAKPGYGPLGGIYTGLVHSGTAYNFVLACDMPLFRAGVIPVLAGKAQDYQVVVPLFKGFYEPLLALYHRDCLTVMEKFMNEGGRKITDCYPFLKVKTVDGQEICAATGGADLFLNINTPDDWQAFCRDNSFK